MNSIPIADAFRTRVDRIVELMKTKDGRDKSWQKFYPDEYAVALSATRKATLSALAHELGLDPE